MIKTMTRKTIRVWYNPVRKTFRMQIEPNNIRLLVIPNAVYADNTDTTNIIAVGTIARQLYNALLQHNYQAVLDNLNQLLPVIQLLS